eukprot:scaffold152970_cov17-Tisochrysis_lutea.AAC.2
MCLSSRVLQVVVQEQNRWNNEEEDVAMRREENYKNKNKSEEQGAREPSQFARDCERIVTLIYKDCAGNEKQDCERNKKSIIVDHNKKVQSTSQHSLACMNINPLPKMCVVNCIQRPAHLSLTGQVEGWLVTIKPEV